MLTAAAWTSGRLERVQLDAGSWVDVGRGWLRNPQEVYDALAAQVSWRQAALWRYGRDALGAHRDSDLRRCDDTLIAVLTLAVPPVAGLREGRISVQWRWTAHRGRPERGGGSRAPRRYGSGR